MLLKWLNFVRTLVAFGIIYATDPLLQNMTKIVCIRWFTFDIFNYKPLQTVLNYMGQFFENSIVYHTLYLWNEDGDPNFFCISGTSNPLSACSKNLKKFYRLENFRANVLKVSSLKKFTVEVFTGVSGFWAEEKFWQQLGLRNISSHVNKLASW